MGMANTTALNTVKDLLSRHPVLNYYNMKEEVTLQ